MDFVTFQKQAIKYGLDLFDLNSAVKIMDSSKNVVKSILSRWVKEKKIFRLKRKYYSFNKIENKFKFQKLFENTYVGLYSALEFYGTTTQRFNNLDLITNKELKENEINNVKINFSFVNNKLFFGFEKEKIDETNFFISSKEKTIIDCVYFSSKVYLTEVLNFIKKEKNDIDLFVLIRFLKKINSYALNKRIGFLFELAGVELKGLKINNKLTKLNKNLLNTEEINDKWKLIINEDLYGKI